MAFDLNINVGAISKQARESLQNVSRSMATLGTATQKTGNNFSKAYTSTKKFNNSLKNLNVDATASAKSVNSLAGAVGKLNKGLSFGKLLLIAKFLATTINSAMDMIETTNLYSVAMGEATESTNEFIDAINDKFGMDITTIQSAVGTFGLLARSMGASAEQASVLSENTTKLAVDLSSLTNVPIQQVMRDLRSGLLGQSETVYKYGIDVTEASLKAEALRMGIEKSVRNMSQGEKMLLRYNVMLRQTSLSHGDFAKTIETPANQLRILQERVITLGRAIGSVFVPILSVVLPYINAFVRALTTVIQALAKLVGFTPPKANNIKNSFSGISDEADNATESIKKMKNATIGLDELNVISKNDGASAEGAVAGDMSGFDLSEYDNLMSQVQDKASALYDDIMAMFMRIGDIFKPLVDAISPIFEYLYTDMLLPLWDFLKEFADMGLETIASFIEVIAQAIEDMTPWLKGLYEEVILPIATWVGDLLKGFMDNLKGGLDKILLLLEDDEWGKFIGNLLTIALMIGSVIKVAGILGAVFAFLTANPLALIVLAIMAIIAVGNWLYENWDMLCAEGKKIWDKFGEWWNKFWKGVGNFFIGIWNGIVNAFENCINWIIDGINKLIGKINDFLSAPAEILKKMGIDVSWSINEMSPVSFGRVPMLARGGMVDDGQLLRAGEGGKYEAIGSYQGKTTVMPLEETDFVSAISNAVAEAVSGIDGGGTENVLYLDGEVVYRSNQKTKAKKGYPINGGKGVLV